MSDMDDFLTEMERDAEFNRIEDEKYFAAQDKKFEELHEKLRRLRDENKRHMDIIINNLDQLIANKTIIEKTLENSNDFEEVPVLDVNLSVVDLLSKVTGFIKDSEGRSIIDETSNDIDQVTEYTTSSRSKHSKENNCETSNTIKSENVRQTLIPTHTENGISKLNKNDKDIKKKLDDERNAKQDEALYDSTKLLKELKINLSDIQTPDGQ